MYRDQVLENFFMVKEAFGSYADPDTSKKLAKMLDKRLAKLRKKSLVKEPKGTV